MLAACVTIPQATADDVAFLAGTATARSRLLELAASTALVAESPAGTYTVHPLLHELLRRQVAHRAHSDVLRCAAWRMSETTSAGVDLYSAVGDAFARSVRGAALQHGTPPAEVARAAATLVTVAPAEELAAAAHVVLAYVRELWLVANEPELRQRVADACALLGVTDPLRTELAGWLAYGYCQAGLADKAHAWRTLASRRQSWLRRYSPLSGVGSRKPHVYSMRSRRPSRPQAAPLRLRHSYAP